MSDWGRTTYGDPCRDCGFAWTATGEESAAVLKAIPNKNFMLNWDPGNAAALGTTPYPDG